MKSTAEAIGVSARPVRSGQMLADRLAEGGVTGMVVDLDTGELGIGLIAEAVAAGVPQIVAFGPHVEAEAFAAAREAGAHRVLARGAFAERLPQILTQLDEGSPEAGSGSG